MSRKAQPAGPDTLPLKSAADRVASYDAADFPVPSGREEEWRFTPFRRLRGVLDGGASELRLKSTADLPAGIELDRKSVV